MGEYIKREDALKEVDRSLSLNEAYSRIASHIIAADVVEVLCRCKDCKHWMDFPNAGCTDFVKVCALAEYLIRANGYCRYGERKEVKSNG